MSTPIEKAKLIIAQRFRESLSLERLSGEVGWSKYHFLRVFKQETGTTPKEYVNTVRLEHAAHMLRMFPEASMTDIAFESGFSSPSVFSRSFRKMFDMSPVAFKAQLPNTSSAKPVSTIPISYLERKVLQVEASNLVVEQLNKGFSRMASSDGYSGKLYGVFIDAPMHKRPEESRYYMGIEQQDGGRQLSYEIDSGYYTHLDIFGDFQQVVQSIVDFKENRIDPSPYSIDSLVGFEVLQFDPANGPFDYLSTKRKIFIKVKRG